MVTAARIHDDAAALREAVQLEGREKQVQDAGVVGVLDVLHVELPVVGKHLRVSAENNSLALRQDPFDSRRDRLTQILLEGRYDFGETAEHEPRKLDHAQLAWSVVVHAKRRRHATLAFDAIFKSDADEVPLSVVSPGMVDTTEVPGVAARLERDERPAVRTTVFEGVKLPISIACNDDGRVTDASGAEITGLGYRDRQAEKVRHRPVKQAALLGGVDLRVLKEPVGHTRQTRLGPQGQFSRRNAGTSWGHLDPR